MLTLYRGDDYAGQLGKTLTIHLSLDAGLPIEGLKAVFEFYDIKKEFTPIQYENDFVIEVSHNQSKKYPLGVSYGKLYCVDSAGKIRTFCNRIPICVTTNLQKVYGSDGLDKQDVHVYALVHWDNIAGKPNYYPSTIEEVEGLEEALRQAGKVKTVNNIEPDENGNIQIEIPSCKVISVNGKEGVVILNAGDIGYGDDRTVDSALAEAEENIKTNADNIDSLGQQVTEHIDNTYTKSEVDDKINQNAAHYLTKRTGTEGHYTYPQFATHADLAAAKAAHTEANPQFFYGIEGHTPDKNDYCVVLADETHGGATTRYAFVGEWDDNGYFRYQYTINQTAFTEEQWAAINSLTSVDEDGNLCFDGIPFINSSGELLFTEDDPIFTAWKNEVQIILGSNASVASGKYKQIAIGAHAQANGQNAIALGSSEPGGKTNGPRATAQNAIAIGAGANATAVNAIQLLAGTNNTSGTMQIGNKRVAFVSDIPISQADIDDYRYYKGHWDMSVTYKTGDIVRAERTVEGQEEKEVTYFKSLQNNNRANNPFTTPTYWSVTTDDEGLEKLTLFVKAAIATLTGADIPVSPTNTDKIDVALGKKLSIDNIGQHQFPPESHSHAQSEVTGLEAALANTLKPDKDGLIVASNYDLTIGAIALYKGGYASFHFDESGNEQLIITNDFGENIKFPIHKGSGTLALEKDLADKLTDADLKTLCTTCGISLVKSDGTPKTRAELLIDLFGKLNSQLKATIEANAVIFLETDGTVINRGSERIKKFDDLLALVQTGRVVLKSTATTSLNSSPVLFRPQLMNSDTILFDATGDISGIMRTRNIKVTKEAVETEEGVDIKVTNGNLQTLIRDSDLNARLPYALVSPTDNTIRNRSVNAFTMEGDFSPAFPSPTSGYARDFLINLTVTTAGSFELPEGISSKGDDLSFESGKKYLIAMTEYEARKFLVKLLDVTEA